MKKILIITLSLILSSMILSVHAKEMEDIDKIVAIVNDDVVTRTELNRSLSIARLQMSEAGSNAPAIEDLQKHVLDQLIDKKLQLQIAKQVGIQFTDEDVDHIIKNLAEKNNVQVDELYRRINSEGMSTADYRAEIREQMTVQKLQQQEVASRIVVTPDEISAFMKSSLSRSNVSREFHLEDVLVSLPDEPSSDQVKIAEKQGNAVLTAMKQGKEIKDVERNDLGWRKFAELPRIFAGQVNNMKVNDIAGPIRAPNGFHILRLVADRSSGEQSEAPNRTQVQQMLMQRKFEEHVQNWVSKMRSQAFISTTMKS